MKRRSSFSATKSCMALVILSPRRHRRTSSFWNASSSASHFPGRGSLQGNEVHSGGDVPDPAAPQEAPKLPLVFQKGQGPFSHLAEVVVCSFETSSRQTRAASAGEVPSTAGLRRCVALPWASNTQRQEPPSRRQGDALCGTALTVTRASAVAVSAPCGLPLPAGGLYS